MSMPPIQIPVASNSISNVALKSRSARTGVVVNFLLNSSNVVCCFSPQRYFYFGQLIDGSNNNTEILHEPSIEQRESNLIPP
jgi:hypothetical protein